MKITAFFLLYLFACFFSSPAEAANYSIELKNGATFVTPHYWEEGRQVKFLLFGGVAGFDKQYIKQITKTVLEAEEPYQTPEVQTIAPPPGTADIQSPAETDEAAQKEEPGYISIVRQNEYLNRRDDLLKKLNNAKNEIQTADKKGVETKKKQFEKEFIALNNEYRNLFNEVVEANNGTPPPWWPTIWPKDIRY